MYDPKDEVLVTRDVLFQPLGDEAVLLNLNYSRYYGLDDVGRRMWELLAEHGGPEPVVQQMLREYDVEEAALRRDLAALVEKLQSAGLISRARPGG